MVETVSVTLPSHWLSYARMLVASGRFQSLDDALENALRLMESAEAGQERLERLLRDGEESGDAGSWDLQSFLADMRESDAGREAA